MFMFCILIFSIIQYNLTLNTKFVKIMKNKKLGTRAISAGHLASFMYYGGSGGYR